MMAIDWRSVAVAIVFLIDLIVFANLVRDEFRAARSAVAGGRRRLHGNRESPLGAD
jgi:hypothetical protein